MSNENLSEKGPAIPSVSSKVDPFEGVSELVYKPSDFDSDFFNLYQQEPFLGSVSARLCKREDPKVPTAYVTVSQESVLLGNPQVFMGYNPKWFGTLKPEHRIGVLRHELYHVVLGHIFDRMPTDKRWMKLFNVAADMAINSIIGEANLPSDMWFPGKDFPNLPPKLRNCIKNLPQLQSMEFYFEKIKKVLEEMGEGGDGDGDGDGNGEGAGGSLKGGELDDHSGWGNDLPEEIKEILKEKIRQYMEEGLRQAEMKGAWGSVPAEIQELIRLRVRGEVDWRAIVRQFFGKSRTLERISTVKKINKKAPYLFPGVRRPLRANFLFAIDQSGSMSDEEVAKGFAEVFQLSGEAEVDVVNFDTEVDEKSLHTWKKGRKWEWKRTRCGGTDFNCVRRWVGSPKRRGKYSGVVLFTDGYADSLGAMPPGTRVIWCITESGTMENVRPGDLAVKMKHKKPEK